MRLTICDKLLENFIFLIDSGGAILDPEDIIKDVLDDNDFVSVGESKFN